jgi:hypothetical protein
MPLFLVFPVGTMGAMDLVLLWKKNMISEINKQSLSGV